MKILGPTQFFMNQEKLKELKFDADRAERDIIQAFAQLAPLVEDVKRACETAMDILASVEPVLEEFLTLDNRDARV
jgi:hypothetical protein